MREDRSLGWMRGWSGSGVAEKSTDLSEEKMIFSESSEKVVHSKIHLVDLAGSERTKKTGSGGLTLKEANYIN